MAIFCDKKTEYNIYMLTAFEIKNHVTDTCFLTEIQFLSHHVGPTDLEITTPCLATGDGSGLMIIV